MDEQLRFIPSNLVGEVGKDTQVFARPLLNEEHQTVVSVANFPDNFKKITEFEIASDVIKDTETVIVEYTVPTGKTAILVGGEAAGLVDAHFKIYIFRAGDWEQKGEKYNSWNFRNVSFGTIEELVAGEKVKITVEHRELEQYDFPGSIFINLR